MESANCVPYMLTCQRALNAYELTCQRVLRAYMLTCANGFGHYVLIKSIFEWHVVLRFLILFPSLFPMK